jgi:hypothetical protein
MFSLPNFILEGVTVFLESPADYSALVRISIEGEGTIRSQRFSNESLELRWLLDPPL